MSTGYSEDGVEDIICEGPPSAGDDGGGEDFPDPKRAGADPKGRLTACGSRIPTWFYTPPPGLGWWREYEGNAFQPIWRGFFEEFKPNCIFGGWGANFRTAAFGDGRFVPTGGVNIDMTLEFWIKLRLDPTFDFGAGPPSLATYFPSIHNGANNSLQGTTYSSLAAIARPQFGIISYGGAIRARYIDAGLVNAEIDITAAMSRRPGWQHVAITLARGGNMTAYVNGLQVGTVGGVIAYTIDRLCVWMGHGNIGYSDPFGWYGPMALHGSVLTAAQIRASYYGKVVQVNATTEWAIDTRQGPTLTPELRAGDAYHWMWVDNRVGASGGPICSPWARVWELMDFGINGAAYTIGLGTLGNLYALVPTGCVDVTAGGELHPIYPDLSANGRDLGLIVYWSSAVMPYAFENDPFWR